MLSQEIDDYTVDIEKTKEQIDKTIGMFQLFILNYHII